MAIKHIGTTFDIDYAQSLGLDPENTLQRIIDLGLSPIRIGIKWNTVENKPSQYQWDRYDSVIQKLAKNNTETILTIGMKSPRWPEYFIPKWINWRHSPGKFPFQHSILVDKQYRLQEVLIPFLERAINRYNGYRTIISIQIENEPFFRFGPDRISISEGILDNEIEHIRKVTNLPILLTTQGLPTTGLLAEHIKNRNLKKKTLVQKADIVGFNVFQSFEGRGILGRKKIYKASNQAWKYLEKWIKRVHSFKKECIISELQAEPWQSKVNLHDAYANSTCNPDIINDSLKQLDSMNMKTVLLWGVEFHLACEKVGNSLWIKKILKNRSGLLIKP